MEVNKCPNCGASLNADTESYSTTCPYCGSTLINKAHKSEERDEQKTEDNTFESTKSILTDQKVPEFNVLNKIKFNGFIFIILLIFFWPLAIVYAVICNAAKSKRQENDKNNRNK